jgi:thioester reductase-like protein
MIINKFGDTDIYLSAVGIGTYALGGGGHKYGWGPQDDKESTAAIRRAVELGINWIDTAPVYGEGRAEKIVGQALDGIRDKVIISTKCGLHMDEKKEEFVYDLRRESIRAEVEASLKRLNTDVIDLYQLHRPFPEEQLAEAWRTMEDLVKEGKIRCAGVSAFSLEQMKRVQAIHPVKFLQPFYNMLYPAVEDEGILDYCRGSNIGVIAYSTMATGFLTGKFTREKLDRLPPDDLRRVLDHFQEPYFSVNLHLVEELRAIAERNNRTVAQLAIAWVLRRPEVTSAIVGARRPSQIEETVQAGDWVLSREDTAELDTVLSQHHTRLRELKNSENKDSHKKFHLEKNSISPDFETDPAVDITVTPADGSLRVSFTYNKDEYDRGSMETFANSFKSNLLKVIHHCVEKKKEISALGMKAVDYHIQRDYERYQEQVKQEKWPDLTVRNRYKYILLTGAAGYLGSYLVRELLENTSAVLYLPVRGAAPGEAEKRFKRKMVFYFGRDFFDMHKERLVVLRADLRENRLKIDAHYDELCETVDAVVHSAANVRHHGAYRELYKDNVEATEHLLHFAMSRKKKDFHFISTLDTGRGHIPGKTHLLFTEYCRDEGQITRRIYAKSKFEAEKRVLVYRDKGLNTFIYRCGNLTFHSDTGKFQENIQDNFFYAVLKAVVKVGFFSENMRNMRFELSFINHAARAIVMLLARGKLKNEIYHIANPHILAWKEMAVFLRGAGIEVNEQPVDNLAQFEGDGEYEKIIERVKLDAWVWEEKPATLTVPKVDRTAAILEKLDFHWPEVDQKHIEKMIAYCREVGFL